MTTRNSFIAEWVISHGDDWVECPAISLDIVYLCALYVAHDKGLLEMRYFPEVDRKMYRVTEAGLNFIKGEANHVGNID